MQLEEPAQLSEVCAANHLIANPMLAKTGGWLSAKERDMTDDGHMFRYWVELRDLGDASIRTLPLRTVMHVHIPKKKGEQQRPGRECLRLEDGSSALEASSFEELAAQLAIKYPDHLYERTLHREPDLRAEHAMDELARLIAHAAVERWMRECAAGK